MHAIKVGSCTTVCMLFLPNIIMFLFCLGFCIFYVYITDKTAKDTDKLCNLKHVSEMAYPIQKARVVPIAQLLPWHQIRLMQISFAEMKLFVPLTVLRY